MIVLDGSHGEGGGQILRSALALSILTGRPFKLVNVRANRKPPGLRPQHVMSVRAAGDICQARYKGSSVGSSTLDFEPGEVKAGKYHFSIGTAGATGLVLHTVYLPLALRGGADSELTITGGTHVSTSPCYHYNATTWAGYLKRMGIEVELEMVRPGFYPRGGGEIRATIRPCSRVRGLRITDCPELTTAGGFSAVAGLVERQQDIARRQARRLYYRLKQEEIESQIPDEYWPGGPGTVVGCLFRQAPVPSLFFAVGERGRPAEAVADDAADQAVAFRAAKAPVDPHAADQIVLPLALSQDASEYRTSEVTRHLTTNIDVIRKFLDRDISCDGEEGTTGVVRVAAAGL
ncbi:MAG TPA: RNA 3'-terminal phosphate cyclase [Fimbriiglobus sp.]|jgi:RNA 3'-terminal phosphate cyclase (ATP)|nr:RNA 3'-terminal phosphate cyclase [Fimbriiglobus sp.]